MLLQDGEPLRIGAKGQEDDSMGERVCCASLRNRVQIPGTHRKKADMVVCTCGPRTPTMRWEVKPEERPVDTKERPGSMWVS